MTSLTNASPLEYANATSDDRASHLSRWLAVGIVAVLMIATFRFNLIRLWGKTNPFNGDGGWEHAILVPLIGLYYLYMNRDELAKARVVPVMPGRFTRSRLIGAGVVAVLGLLSLFVGPSVVASQAGVLQFGGKLLLALSVMVVVLNWGLASTIFGLVFFGYGIWPGQNDYFKDLGMVITLFGVVLTLCGWDVMKIAAFPIAFLICALPWPGLFYSWLASPLQVLAANVAVGVLQVGGVPDAFQSGTKIHLGAGRTLNVAEACSGLKSLMTFVTLGAALAFLSARPLWQKLFVVASAVPIAIFCNVMRVSGQGLLDHYAGQDWSENFAHQFVGMVMLVPAFFLLLALLWVLDMLFLEDGDEETERAVAVATGASRAIVTPAAAAVAAPALVPATIPVRAVKARVAEAIDEKVRREGAGSGVEASPAMAAPAVTAPAVTVPPPAARPVRPAVGGRRAFVPPGFVPPGSVSGSNEEKS